MQGLCVCKHACVYMHLQIYVFVKPLKKSKMMEGYHLTDKKIKTEY